jgi:hypothetical protein
MAENRTDSFVVELVATRHLEASEMERAIARVPGVTSVSVTNPYAEDPDALEEPKHPEWPEDEN